jgi:peroxiredoxin
LQLSIFINQVGSMVHLVTVRKRGCRILTAAAILLLLTASLLAQEKIVWSEQEKPIAEQIRGLRKLDDNVRARTTKELALQIRQLPVTPNKIQLASGLAGLATEGDFGRDTLQEVTTTLAAALREQPQAGKAGKPNDLYVQLASLVRYEHMRAEADNPQFSEAMAKLDADDAKRQDADFTLTDLQGKTWHFRDLRGKVVLVNFWATWCPPCRKEMPDLQALSEKFKDQGFVVLAISDEEAAKVSPYLAEHKVSYPVLLDPGRKVNDLFIVEGIPKSFVYDRSGKMGRAVDRHAHAESVSGNARASGIAVGRVGADAAACPERRRRVRHAVRRPPDECVRDYVF